MDAPAPRSWRDRFWLRRLPILGVLAIGIWLLGREAPHEFDVVYDLAGRVEGLTALEVEIGPPGDAPLRRARFERPAGAGFATSLSHVVRLAPGDYRACLKFVYADRSEVLERPLTVDRWTERVVVHLSPPSPLP